MRPRPTPLHSGPAARLHPELRLRRGGLCTVPSLRVLQPRCGLWVMPVRARVGGGRARAPGPAASTARGAFLHSVDPRPILSSGPRTWWMGPSAPRLALGGLCQLETQVVFPWKSWHEAPGGSGLPAAPPLCPGGARHGVRRGVGCGAGLGAGQGAGPPRPRRRAPRSPRSCFCAWTAASC